MNKDTGSKGIGKYSWRPVPCSTHPDAPHGFDRDSSHSLDRYVCDCEGWEAANVATAAQQPAPETAPKLKMHKSWIHLIDSALAEHGIAAFGGGAELVRRYNEAN